MIGIIGKGAEQWQHALPEPPVLLTGGENIREEMVAAARVALSTLIVEVEGIPEEELLRALRGFRRQRPHTRILVLADNRKPGDSLIARIIALGIYDLMNVVREEGDAEEESALFFSSLARQLEADPATYADVARWDVDVEENSAPTKGSSKAKETIKESIKETVIIQERLIGTPILVVAGAHPGSGATHVSLQMAQLLAGSGSVAYVELLETTKGFTRENMQNPVLLNGVDIWRVRSVIELTKRYQYIIINVGCWQQRNEGVIEEAKRATRCFVTVGSSSWRYREFCEQLQSLQEARSDWMVMLQHPAEKQYKEISKDMGDVGWEVLSVPYQPDAFQTTDLDVDVYREALNELIPAQRQRGSWFSKLWMWLRHPLRMGGSRT